jgi:hypothetical protein
MIVWIECRTRHPYIAALAGKSEMGRLDHTHVGVQKASSVAKRGLGAFWHP